jgi:threonine synthase
MATPSVNFGGCDSGHYGFTAHFPDAALIAAPNSEHAKGKFFEYLPGVATDHRPSGSDFDL